MQYLPLTIVLAENELTCLGASKCNIVENVLQVQYP